MYREAERVQRILARWNIAMRVSMAMYIATVDMNGTCV